MSSSTPTTDRLFPESESLTGQVGSLIRRPVEAIAFWAAVALPFMYVPLLVGGFQTPQEQTAFLALLVLNFVALVAGHNHRR